MEPVQLLAEPSDVLGGHVLSLASGDVLRADSSIIFSQDALSSGIISTDGTSDEVQTFMSVPVHVVQDAPFVGPVLIKNAAGNTFLLDPRQCNILGDTVEETQSQFIIAPSSEGGDGDQQSTSGIMGLDMDFPYITNVGNVVLSDNGVLKNSIDINSSGILQLGSQMLQGANKLLPEGMCIDMSQLSIVSSNGIVSYVSASADDNVHVPTPQESENELSLVQEKNDEKESIVPASTQEHVASRADQDKRVVLSPVRLKRGRGRPRKVNAHQEDIMDPPVGKPPYKCDSCGFEAALWGRLKRHKESHKNEKPHRCKECGASYNVEANLTLHMATHSSDQLKCPECQRAFTRVASLRSHLMLHEREDNLFCSECGDEFALQYQLDSHVMEHQDDWVSKNVEKVFECVKCQRQFSRTSALKEHMREHVKVKHSLVRRKHDRTHDRSEFSHKCATCGKVFQKPSQLVRHTRIHTGERPYPCDICGKAFSQKGSLQIHMTKHNGEKPYECDFCNAKFSQKGNLRAHIQRVHSIPQQGMVTYRCTECPCIFKKLGSLNSHMGRAHSQAETIKTLKSSSPCSEQLIQANVNQIMAELVELERVTNCEQNSNSNGIADVCKGQGQNSLTSTTQIFENSNGAERSEKTDSGDILQEALCKSGLQGRNETDLSCKEKSTAGTGFITLADRALDGTVRRYTIKQRRIAGVRWHQCSFCSKEFKKPSDLVRHIRIHTHEKPFKCPHCFRAFSVKSTLTAHIRTHSGQKQYSCPDCDKKFSATSSLKVHQRLHNGERPFACSVCNRTFRTSGHRQTHWLQHCDPSNNLLAIPCKKRRRKTKKPEIQLAESENLSDVLLEEPIVITEEGLMQNDASRPPKPPAARLHNCDQCSASFRNRNQLKAHQRTHSGERPFQCQICDRSFVSNGVLKAHILTHEAVKAFKCSICSSAFSTQGSLKRHLIIHSSSKPFMCPYCHKTFKNKMNCKKHIKNHKTEVARAVAQQELQGQQFVVSVTDGFNGGEIVIPHFQTFSGNNLGDVENLAETTQEKLVQSGGVITHTLLADASGTITLPTSLTQENIREIEDTLNQQLSTGGSSTVLINATQHPGIQLTSLSVDTNVPQGAESIDFTAASDAAHAEDVAAAANLAASEAAPETITLSEDAKSSALVSEATDISSAIFGQSFDQQAFEACTFPGITLQDDHINLSGIEQEATISANMEAILPQSRGSDRRRNCENDENNIRDNIREEIEDLALPDNCEDNSINELSEESSVSTRPSAVSCEQCGRTFKRLSLLKVHLQNAHMTSPKPHVCSYCNRSFASSNGLRFHIRSHAGEKSHVCKHCTLSFASLPSLSRHMAVHTDKRPLPCSRCSDSFRTQSQLRKHLKNHDLRTSKHQRSNKKVPAIILSQEQTSALANQSVDTAVTVSEKILIASAIELSKKEIAEESKSIGTEPVFSNQCKYCPKSFKKPSDLVRHVRIHTGERPFRCDLCFRSFTVKSTLSSHRKTHLADAPKMFPCHVCSLRFSTKGSLKVHMRLHTGSKPFKCHLCSMRFRTSGHRKAHLQSHGHSGNRSRSQKNQQVLNATEEIQHNEAGDTQANNEVLTHQIITEDGTIVEVDTASLLAAGGSNDGSSLQLQIDDSLLQQFQFQNGGNVIIQENGTVQFVPNLVVQEEEENAQLDNAVTQIESVASNPELSSLLPGMPTIESYESLAEHDVDSTQQDSEMFEIHTDEHGQIVNIQQTLEGNGVVFADISDLNLSGGTKVSIDGSQFEILDEVSEMNPENDIDPSAFVTLDINDIIMAPTPSSKKGKGNKAKTETGHPCSVCGKVFAKPSQLQRHVRIHTGERPFSCTQCWKAFNQKNALKAHMKRHTGERPFKCLYCEHAFTQRGNLKTHIGRAHPHATDAVLPKKKKVVPLPKNNVLDDVTFRLELENVVGDLFPQMQAATETD